MKKYILALDQGTTSSRAILFDEHQKVIASSFREFKCIYPHPGWVEQDPEEVFASQYGVMAEVLALSSVSPKDIAAIGIACQRETTVVWDRITGKPIYNAIVWQCRRTAEYCEKLKKEGQSDYIKKTTGLLPDAYFSATKLMWILDHVEGAREKAENGDLLFGTVDSFLIWRLTNGRTHVTDRTNASRTMLFDIHNLKWDEKLLKLFRIPPSMMPVVLPSSSYFGSFDSFGAEIPILGVAGDQQAALFGQGCFDAGEAKNTYGTGCFLLMNTGKTAVSSTGGLLTTLAASVSKEDCSYALEGSIFTAGALITWLRDELHFFRKSEETEELASSIENNGGVYMVPAFTGLGAPYWDMYAKGAVVGLTAAAGKAHFVRAALESMAYRTYDLLSSIEKDMKKPLSLLRADGGVSKNNFLMQFQTDILGVPVIRPKNTELTALGAARLAGLQCGVYPSLDFFRNEEMEATTFLPNMEKNQVEQNLMGWKKAVESVHKPEN